MRENLFFVLSGNINKILSILVGLSLPFLLLSYFIAPLNFTKGFLISLGVAYLDMWVALYGIRRAIKYSATPKKGLMVFHKFTFLRLVVIGVSFYALSLVLRLKTYASGLCVGFLLIHILLILYLVMVSRYNDGVKKGE